MAKTIALRTVYPALVGLHELTEALGRLQPVIRKTQALNVTLPMGGGVLYKKRTYGAIDDLARQVESTLIVLNQQLDNYMQNHSVGAPPKEEDCVDV